MLTGEAEGVNEAKGLCVTPRESWIENEGVGPLNYYTQ